MADKDFIVKNGLVTGTNTASFGTAVYHVANGNVGIANSTPADKLVVAGNITATGNVGAVSVNASTGFYGTVQTATQGTIDHNSLANYDANRHVDHTSVSISAGNGLTGGGTIASNRSLSVVAGTSAVVNSSGVHVVSVPTSLTFASDGTGAAATTTYNGNTARTISYNSIGAPKTDGTGASGTWSISINGSASSATNASAATNAGYATSAGSTSQAITFASDGTGAAAGTTFNGGTARTISYNSVGAPKTDGTNASGTWSININGSASSATNASAATNATYAASAGSATNATYATSAGSATNATYAAQNQHQGTLVETVSGLNVSAIQSSTAFNYGYNSYVLVFHNVIMSGVGGLGFYMYSNGSYDSSAGAYGVSIRGIDGGGAGDQTNNGETGMWITPQKNWGGGATYPLNGTITCQNAPYTSGKKVCRIQLVAGGQPGTSSCSYFGCGVYQNRNNYPVTGFQITPNGTFTGGNVYVYGLNW